MAIFTDEIFAGKSRASGRFDPLAQVRGYWEGLRGHGQIPLRSQINPRGIESALSSTFLIERIAPGMARFRIAGMNLTDLMGMEVRGMPFSVLMAPSARTELGTRLEAVFQSPAILTADLIAEPGIAQPDLNARLLILPLRGDAGRSDMALGCLALSGTIGRAQRRFTLGRTALTVLETTETSARHTKGFVPQVMTNAREPAFAETQAAFEPAPQGGNIPYLRVVK